MKQQRKKENKPYYIFRKNSKGSSNTQYYYIMAKHPVSGKILTKSTGCTDYNEAVKTAYSLFIRGSLFPVVSKQTVETPSMSFGEYASSWWTEDSRYVISERTRGKNLTPDYVYENRKRMEKHILPFFKDIPLNQIDINCIQNWMIQLKTVECLQSKTIQNIRSILNTMLNDAKLHRLITENPLSYVKPNIVHSTGHGRPTNEEYLKLFSNPAIWKNNYILMSANFLSSITGMRNGEIRALRWCDLTEKQDCIMVNHNFTSRSGLKLPKASKTRKVPVPHDFWEFLTKTPGPSDQFVFSYNGARPVGSQTLQRSFEYAFEQIGVSKRDQRLRKLSFHSWRVTANSRFIEESDLSAVQLREVVGHESDSMTQLYYKQSDVLLNKARTMLESNPSVLMGTKALINGKVTENSNLSENSGSSV